MRCRRRFFDSASCLTLVLFSTFAFRLDAQQASGISVRALTAVDTAVTGSQRSIPFEIANTTAGHVTVRLTCDAHGGVNSCSLRDRSLTIAAGEHTYTAARYRIGTKAPDSAVIVLTASVDELTSSDSTLVRITGGSNAAAAPAALAVALTLKNIDVHFPTDSVGAAPNTQGLDAIYFVTNNTSTTQTINMTCAPTGSVSACTPVPTSDQLAANSQLDYSASYNTGAAGSGTIKITAKASAGTDTDTLIVGVQSAANPGGPLVVVDSANPGTLLERSACVMTDAGIEAAFQCGNLVVAHAMPAYRTMDRDRTLTLLYNSATAKPSPIVMADVSLPSSVSKPDSLKATLTVGGVLRASAWYSASAFSSGGAAQRIALSFDASALATGVYAYALTVSNYYGGSPQSTTANGELIIVNRAASPYGAGWHVAGVEQIVTGQRNSALLLTRGDGSAAVYENAGTNIWVAPGGAYRDTIRYGGILDPGGVTAQYWRRMLDSTTVFYASTGRQTWVSDRSGNKANYTYTAAGALSYIQIAPYTQTKRYNFGYDASGKLDYVTDPASRRLEATVSGGVLTLLRDPGRTSGQDILFTYTGTLIHQRRSERGAYTQYGYVTGTDLLQSVTLPATSAGSGVIGFIPVQTRGLNTLASGKNATVASSAATLRVDGPRTDVADTTLFYVNRYSAPVRTVDALAHSTYLSYSPLHPLLVDSVTFADGRIIRLSYDASARLTSEEDLTNSSGSTARVDYIYRATSSARELPDTLKLPREAGTTDVISFTKNANGTLQQIRDARGHVTQYTYNASGQVTAVAENSVSYWTGATRSTGTLTTSIYYNTLGNIDSVKTPLSATTRFRYDTYGNTAAVISAVRDSVRYTYTPLNLQDTIIRYDTAGVYKVSMIYDAEGNQTRLCDPRTLCRNWSYDVLNRLSTMTDEFSKAEQHTYDLAGNETLLRNRQGDTILTRFDALNRPTWRLLGQVKVDNSTEATLYDELTGTVLVPVDTLTFQYDAMSRITRAENRIAVSTRSYTREGAIQLDSQYVKVGGNIPYNALRYTYHPSGRRKTLQTSARTFTYYYEAGNLLDRITWGTESANFDYDELGRRDSVYVPNVSATAYHYDKDGRVQRTITNRPAGTMLVDLEYERIDSMGRPVQFIDRSARFNGLYQRRFFRYDGRNQLIAEGTEGVGAAYQRYVYDSSGNRTREYWNCTPQWTLCTDSTQYLDTASGQPTNRVPYLLIYNGGTLTESHAYVYDYNGNLIRDGWTPPGVPTFVLRRYYSAADQLEATRATSVPANLFFLYDALGRRQRGSAGDSTNLFFYDGQNVQRYGSGQFLHADGVDEPVAAFLPQGIFCDIGTTNVGYYTTIANRLLDFYGNVGKSCVGATSAWGWGSQSGAIADSHTFGLERSPGSTDLSFFRNRFYDARSGRFMQEDPIGFAGDFNLYAYSGNNPAVYTDPFGLDPCFQHPTPECVRQLAVGVGEALAHGINLIGGAMREAAFMLIPIPGVGEGRLTKAINLPSWKRIGIDMEHIASGHMAGGARVSALKSLFPESMTAKQVERTVRQAYRLAGEKLATQGDRVLLRGQANGLTVEMWVNRADRMIETAYPIWK